MKYAEALDQWARQELENTRYEGRRDRLKKLLADLHKHPDSLSLPVGSPRRLLAETHERTVMRQAVHLGYQPPEQELKELGLHLGLGMGLGL